LTLFLFAAYADEELYGYFHKNIMPSKKFIYDYVVFDSGQEESFDKKV